MARYIDADLIKEKLQRTIINGQTAFINNVLIGLLDKAPTEDVQEIKHGHWEEIDNKIIEHGLVERKGKTWMCTNCGEAHKTRTNPDMNYCPNCGAKMDGGDTV
jgi:rubrerythrin